MSRSYCKPTIVEYGRDEIVEMIGPVKTQYPCVCDSQLQPNPYSKGAGTTLLQISFTLDGDCPDYERVFVQIPGSGGQAAIGYDFDRSEGTEIGNQWSIVVPNFQYLGDVGTYDVAITLTDAAGITQLIPCDTTFTVEL